MVRKKLDFSLLGLGLLLVCGPMVLAHFDRSTYDSAGQAVRMLNALGGGLIGTAIPGLLEIEIKAFRAVGAVAFVLLFYLYKPGSASESDKPPEAQAKPATSTTPVVSGTASRPPAQIPSGSTFEKSPVCVGNDCKQDIKYDEHNGPAPATS